MRMLLAWFSEHGPSVLGNMGPFQPLVLGRGSGEPRGAAMQRQEGVD